MGGWLISSSENGDSAWCGVGVGLDILDRSVLKWFCIGTVDLDGELLEGCHGLVGILLGVDGEDHSHSAVDAGSLFAIEPF